MKLFDPIILGDGATINKRPTLPKHAVRKTDMEAHTSISKYEIDGVLAIDITKETDDYFVQVFDADKEVIYPDSIKEENGVIVVTFLKAQTGTIKVLFVGGSSGI